MGRGNGIEGIIREWSHMGALNMRAGRGGRELTLDKSIGMW